MFFHWYKKCGSVPTCTIEEDDADEVENCNTSGMPSPLTPLLPGVCRTSRCTSRELPATLIPFSASVLVKLFGQGLSTRIWHRLFLHIKLKPGFRFGFSTSHRGWRLRHARGILLLCMNQRPINGTVKSSLNSVLKTVKRGTCKALTSWKSGRRMRDMLKYKLHYQPI